MSIMIPITKPYSDSKEPEAAKGAVESGWVSQGPKVAEFERAVADYCGTAHAVAMSNCTLREEGNRQS
jgi:dTDP-4-amino-4,6-dideoxygalactose transaminase